VRRVFENLKALAAAAGGDLDHAVRVTVYLTDLQHFALVNRVMPSTSASRIRRAPALGRGGVAEGRRGRDRRDPRVVTLRDPGAAARRAARHQSARRGPRAPATLERLGLRTVQDLLFHLPLRYEDRTRVVPIGTLRSGDRAVIEGEIQLAEVVFRRRRALLCRIADGSGFLTLRFFHFSAAQQEGLTRGTRLRCFGEVRPGPAGLEIVHPEYRRSCRAWPRPGGQPHAGLPDDEGVAAGRMRALTSLALAQLQGGGLAATG